MKIAFFETEPWEKPYFENALKGHELVFFDRRLEKRDLKKIKDADIIVCFIYSKIDKKVLDSLKNLKFITTMSTGYDHIDVKECKKRKVLVSNVPSYGENTVAEHTFALLLALSRKIIPSFEKARRGDFSVKGLRGFDLKGKVLGVVGTGKIGKHVIRIAKGFEMKVIAYDKFPNAKLAKRYGFKYVSYEDLLKQADIITFHVPLLKETYHMFNRKHLNIVKKGVIIVNTSRGAVIETEALIEGLNKGIISGCALDVLEEECVIKEEKQLLSKHFPKKCLQLALEEHILLQFDNVIITPHNAFNSNEALLRIVNTTIQNIKGFIKGKPKNLVV